MFFFFFNDTATTEIYTLSLHDALPILSLRHRRKPTQPEVSFYLVHAGILRRYPPGAVARQGPCVCQEVRGFRHNKIPRMDNGTDYLADLLLPIHCSYIFINSSVSPLFSEYVIITANLPLSSCPFA